MPGNSSKITHHLPIIFADNLKRCSKEVVVYCP